KYDNAYNNELANDLGNLVQRLATLCHKNDLGGGEFTPAHDGEYHELMDNFQYSRGIDYAWGKLQELNRRIDETKPWSVAKADPAAARVLLGSLVADLLQANHLLKPYLPVATQIEKIFTAEKIVPPETPLFPKN
ncbi:methionine--tRNA ligase, partial [Candidatus Saccharibacteria bacterium]|nr:methionine--tRNA ligase [Candidatus Saccharibacteria bacterium]